MAGRRSTSPAGGDDHPVSGRRASRGRGPGRGPATPDGGQPGPGSRDLGDQDPGGRDLGKRDAGSRGSGKKSLAGVVAVAVLGLAGWVVLSTPLISVRDIHVNGVRLVPRERVISAAGIAKGTPMVRVDLEGVRRQVLSIREVESATVVRQWPDALRVTVRERTPVAVVTSGGVRRQIDRFGVTVLVTEDAPTGLPRLTVSRPDAADPATRAALAVLGVLPPDIVGRLVEVEAPSAESVTLRLRSGPTIVWGAPERGPEKLRALRALLWSPKSHRAKRIDISSPEVVSTR
jgi:cell division protein FtsQ